MTTKFLLESVAVTAQVIQVRHGVNAPVWAPCEMSGHSRGGAATGLRAGPDAGSGQGVCRCPQAHGRGQVSSGPAAATLVLPWSGRWPLAVAAGETPTQNGELTRAGLRRQRHRWHGLGVCTQPLSCVASPMASEFMSIIRATLGCHPPPVLLGRRCGSTLLASSS